MAWMVHRCLVLAYQDTDSAKLDIGFGGFSNPITTSATFAEEAYERGKQA
jgi:hypothetical protein